MHTHKGFTLIEALVATAVFVVAMTALANAILYISKLQRRTNALRSANDTARYVSDFLSKEIRNGTPNFEDTTPLTGCSTYPSGAPYYTQYWFELVNQSGDEECFFLSTDGVTASASGKYLWLTKKTAGSTTTLAPQNLTTGTQVSFTSLAFKISNQSDTNSDSYFYYQPYVVINGGVNSQWDSQDSVTVPFETSISLPIYNIRTGQ